MSKKKNSPKVNVEAKPVQNATIHKTIEKEINNATDHKTLNKVFWICTIIIALLAFFINTNTFENTFVLDDHGIIKSNKITKSGITAENVKRIFTTSHRAGDVSDLEHSLYRPLTKTIFAWAWEQSADKPDEEKPFLFHKINVVFYALACALMFAVLYFAFKRNWLLAFLATLLYTVHPMHSEVVANNKSLDEILSVFGMFLCFRTIQLHAKSNNPLWLALMFVSLFIALFSKENLIVIVALVPLFVYYFIDTKNPTVTKLNLDVKQIALYTGITVVMAIVFLWARHNALSQYPPPANKVSAMDNVLALADGDKLTQITTAIALLGKYIIFLLAPVKLSCDYSYSTVLLRGIGTWEFWMAFLFYAGMIYFSIKTLKQKNPIGFGVFFFLIAVSIVSNLIIIIGVSFGDRMMFLPSVGWAIALASVLYWFVNKSFELPKLEVSKIISKNILPVGLVALACIFYSFKTRERNLEWKTDYTLISGDVEKYPESVHLLFYWGNHLTSSEYAEGKTPQEVTMANEDAKQVFKKALGIFPALPSDGYNQFGKAFYKTKEMNRSFLDSAEFYYAKANKEDPTNPVFMNNLGTVRFERAIQMLNTPQGIALLDSAQIYFEKANQKDSTMADYMNNLGAINGQKGNYEKAFYWFNKSFKTDSTGESALLALRSIAMTYGLLGDSNNKKIYEQRANTVQQYRNELVAKKNAENNIN